MVLFYSIQIMLKTRSIKIDELLGKLLGPYQGLGASLWSMFFATMINRFGDFVGSFLALYLSRILGFDAARTGLTISLVFTASMAGSLLSGWVADRIGRKQALLLFQSTVAFINLIVSFFVQTSWAPWLIIFASLFRGGGRPLIGAVLTDLAPANKRKEVFGLQYWSINVGVALGPLVAAVLFERSIPWLFRGDALTTLISVVLIARGVEMPREIHVASALEHHDDRGALRAFVSRPILLAFAGLALLSSLTYSQTGFGLPMTVSQLMGQAGPRSMGYLMSLNAVVVILFSIPIARLLRAWTPLLCMSLSGFFYVIGFGMLALPLPFLGFALSTVIWTTGEIVSSINMGVFLARHSPANWRASFQSFMGVCYSAGWVFGPLIGGVLLKGGNYALLWLATAAGCFLWALLAFAVDRWDRRILAYEA